MPFEPGGPVLDLKTPGMQADDLLSSPAEQSPAGAVRRLAGIPANQAGEVQGQAESVFTDISPGVIARCWERSLPEFQR